MRRIRNDTFIKSFSGVTAAFAAIHFVLESWYTLQYGQAFLGLLPDYVADALLLWGSYLALKDSRTTGVLCGAWGFAFCLHYRAWAWRFQATQNDTATSVDEITMIVLATTLFVSMLCFVITLLMSLPDNAGG